MTGIMYDSVTVGEIPTDAEAVALYIDGAYRNWTAGRLHARKARRLSIAVFASDDADALDIESGDATAADAPGWIRRQQRRDPGSRPVLYSSRDNMLSVLAALRQHGINRSEVRLWSAHYGLGPHICSPRACGAAFTADATQWTDRALARNLDESLLDEGFFPPKHKRRIRLPRPAVHKKTAGAGAAGGLAVGLLAVLHAFGVRLTPAESGAIDALAAMLGGYIAPPGYLTRKPHG